MVDLSDLDFVKKAPIVKSVRPGASPLDRARKKLLADIDAQISLARDPNFMIRNERRKRDGTTEMIERKPKTWIVNQDDDAYITVRFSNKPMPLGGKRGSVIRCPIDRVVETLGTVREHVEAGQADQLIEKMMKEAKRKSRRKNEPEAPAPPTSSVSSISH